MFLFNDTFHSHDSMFQADGGIGVGGEDVDGLDDNVGHRLVKGRGGSETGKGGGASWSRDMG